MGKRIYTIVKNGKKIEMDEKEFETYQNGKSNSDKSKKPKTFGYSGADPKPNGSNVRVNQPTPAYGQANTQQDLDKQRQMLQEIVSLSGALERIQGQVQSQGILTPEQVNALIIPLKQQIMGLADRMVIQSDYRLQPNRWTAPEQPKEEPSDEENGNPFGDEEQGEESEEQQGDEKPEEGMNNPSQRQIADDGKKPADQEQKPQQSAPSQNVGRTATQEGDAQRPQVEQTQEKPTEDTVVAEDDYVRQAREIDPKGFYDPQQLAEILRRLAEENRKKPQPQAGSKSKAGLPQRDLENPSSTFQR